MLGNFWATFGVSKTPIRGTPQATNQTLTNLSAIFWQSAKAGYSHDRLLLIRFYRIGAEMSETTVRSEISLLKTRRFLQMSANHTDRSVLQDF